MKLQAVSSGRRYELQGRPGLSLNQGLNMLREGCHPTDRVVADRLPGFFYSTLDSRQPPLPHCRIASFAHRSAMFAL